MHIPKTLTEAIRYYSDEQTCIDVVATMRWPDGKPVCPKCGAQEIERKHYWLATQKRWKCFACRKQFSVKVDSVFEDSPLSLDIWLIAMWMLVNCKNGVSSYEIARQTGISQKAAWHLMHRIRYALRMDDESMMGGNEGGGWSEVEVDETFIGGKEQNMHLKRRIELRGSAGSKGRQSKAIVMGILDREARQVRAKVIPHVRREVLQSEILNQVAPHTFVYTDAHKGYTGIDSKDFIHCTVSHVTEYVKGQVHTQGIENFWSLLKRGLNGTYVAVEPFHLSRYLDEQMFRYNNRATKDNPLTDADRFTLAVSQIAGKRLTFAELTGKVPGSEF